MNTKISDINCDKCSKSFTLTQRKIKIKNIKLDHDYVTMKYFMCPHCKEKYIISAENNEVREIILNIKSKHQEYKKETDCDKATKLFIEYNDLVAENKTLIKNLIEIYKDSLV